MAGYRTVQAGLRADVRRGFAVATGAVGMMALVELIATLVDYAGPIDLVAALRLVPLDLTLWAFVWIPMVLLCGAGFAAPRAVSWATRGKDAARAEPGALARPIGGPAVTRIFAAIVCAVVYIVWSSAKTFAAFEKYKDHRLAGMLLAVEQVGAIGVLVLVWAGLSRLLDVVRILLDGAPRWVVRANPLGDPWALVTLVNTALFIAIAVEIHKHAYMRPLVPWRHMIDAEAALLGAAVALAIVRRKLWRPKQRKKVALATAGAALVLVPLTLVWLGAGTDTKGMAISASPALERLIAAVRSANDLDGDGFGSLLGENDCDPFDPKVHPGARDIPDDGIDQNCNGHDSSLRDLVAPAGEHMPIPDDYKRPWNVLLITIDATRYDHTTFGGYAKDTTPKLAELVQRSVSFNFAVAPAAGTMASVPAILTSKYFHSGIALDENRKKGMPPKLKPENTTLPEIMKRGGYTTGAILSHEYFNDWGMQQGVDEYDNSIGEKPDPDRVSSDQSTARALAWITRHSNKKWFLWVHYLDPHGHYVAHPDGPQYGDSDGEMEKYDEEIHYTDTYLGKLFDELARTGQADHTIIIITADHGDAFEEHGTRNHGDTLYFELLHVPLVFAVPDLPPRKIDGAVTPLDIVPTIADMCQIDVSDLSFEGRSLVPQIFYGKEDQSRVVFSETQLQQVLRAAVSKDYKLIYDLKNNTYKFFDLRNDPMEKKDVQKSEPTAFTDMQEKLQAWIDRVVFARDADTNQVLHKLDGILLDKAPTPEHAVEGVSFDGGRIEVIGYDGGTLQPGSKSTVSVYFHVKDRPTAPFKIQVATFLQGKVARSSMRTTAEGFLPTNEWHAGDYIRDHFEIAIPADWGTTTGPAQVGLAMQGEQKVEFVGTAAANDPNAAILGDVPVRQNPSVDAGVPAPGGIPPGGP